MCILHDVYNGSPANEITCIIMTKEIFLKAFVVCLLLLFVVVDACVSVYVFRTKIHFLITCVD